MLGACKKKGQVPDGEPIPLSLHKTVTSTYSSLTADDSMHANKIPFLVTGGSLYATAGRPLESTRLSPPSRRPFQENNDNDSTNEQKHDQDNIVDVFFFRTNLKDDSNRN